VDPVGLPFAHLNLRYNPFGDLDRGALAACAVVDPEPLLRALDEPRTVVQLVGAQGRGKTTHLLVLAARVQGSAFVRAFSDAPIVLPPCRVLLLDEADALWPWRRLRAYRHASSVAIATHRDFSIEIRLAGRVPRTFPVGGIDEDRLHLAIERRIERARRSDGPVPRVGRDSVRALLARHGDDLRALERTLYDGFQSLTEVRDVQV
jgi:hypothetical protein